MTAVLVTGASGFIGRATCAEFAKRGWHVRAAVREAARADLPGMEKHVIGDLSGEVQWQLDSVDAVVHLAGIAHELHGQNAEAVYQAVNCAATERLAREAARAGVKRFVFMSSIKVNGERTPIDRPFTSSDEPQPQDRYARSKWDAERALAAVAHETGLEVAILRPPLVYGPGVRANFLRLIRLVERRLPLPFGSIDNRRSLVYLGNLVDVLILAASQPAAAGRTLLVSDGEDLSTPQLAHEIGKALGKEPRLWPVPVPLLRTAATVTGLRAEIGRLVDSLAVDIDETCALLGWRPRVAPSQGIADTVTWYRSL